MTALMMVISARETTAVDIETIAMQAMLALVVRDPEAAARVSRQTLRGADP